MTTFSDGTYGTANNIIQSIQGFSMFSYVFRADEVKRLHDTEFVKNL